MTSIADRYSAAAARLTALIDAVPADAWTVQSPCEDWTAGQVVEHVVSTEAAFLRDRELAEALAEEATSDPLGTWPAVRDAVTAAMADPSKAGASYDGYFGPTTVEQTLDRFYTADLLVHRWDIATAVGLPDFATLDDDELAFLNEAIASYPAEVMRMPGLFGPELTAPAGANATTQLMAFLGRSAG